MKLTPHVASIIVLFSSYKSAVLCIPPRCDVITIVLVIKTLLQTLTLASCSLLTRLAYLTKINMLASTQNPK